MSAIAARPLLTIGPIAGMVTAVVVARGLSQRWGTTPDERVAALPGDDAIPEPDLVTTRAITVRVPRADVWPWIAQMGQGRGGLYSYDALENLVGCQMTSADEIVPLWQAVEVGDEVRLHPEVALAVTDVIAGEALVLRGAVPMSGAGSGEQVPAPYDFTWAFVLRDAGDGTTRLVVRERYGYLRPWAGVLVEPVSLVSFIMSQRMLRGIRDRAERGTRR
jgi:hypothetical protein